MLQFGGCGDFVTILLVCPQVNNEKRGEERKKKKNLLTKDNSKLFLNLSNKL